MTFCPTAGFQQVTKLRGGGETQNITKAEPHCRYMAKKKTWNGKENKHQTKEIGGGDEEGNIATFYTKSGCFLNETKNMSISSSLEFCITCQMSNAIANSAQISITFSNK